MANPIKTQYVALNGTIDLVTPPIAKEPGNAIIADNMQPLWGGGFGRIEGLEPIDFGPIAREYIYFRIEIADPLDASWVGGTVNVNGDVGIILAVDLEENALRVAAVNLEVSEPDTPITITNGEDVTESTVILLFPYGFGSTADEQAQYLADAHSVAMQMINPPNGDGQLRGVAEINGQLIGFRDFGDACEVSVAVAGHAWQTVQDTFIVELSDVTSPDLFIDGGTLTIDSISYIILASAFAADGQTGRVVVDSNVTAAIGTNVLIDSAVVAKTATVGIKTELTGGLNWTFIYHNFYASSGTRYAYGTNGKEVVEVRPDGVIIPIVVNDDRDITDIEVHKNHLFLSFVGGQLGHSVVGEPLSWEILLGAEQFGTGDEITCLQSLVGDYMLIGCVNNIQLLAGTTRDDWTKVPLSNVGVTAGTMTSTFVPVAHSKNGFINVNQTQAYGDFVTSELSANQLLGDAAFQFALTDFFAHSVHDENNQIRFYQRNENKKHVVIQLLSDGSTRATFFKYHKSVKGVWNTDNNTYLALDDGRIYSPSDVVCSFAGEPIEWILRLAYTHCGSSTTIKSWNDVELQLGSNGSLKLRHQHTIDYSSEYIPQSRSSVGIASGGGGRWDESAWNEFYWSSPDYVTPAIYLDGHGKNVSLFLSGNSTYEKNFDISGYTLSYIPRRHYRV